MGQKYERSPVPALDRGLAILELVAAHADHGISFTEIMSRLQLPQASTARLLKALRIRGYVEQSRDHGLYVLGHRVKELLAGQKKTERLREITARHVNALRDETGNTAIFVYWSGRDWVCLCKALHEQALVLQGVGEVRRDLAHYPWSVFLLWFKALSEEQMEDAELIALARDRGSCEYDDFKRHGFVCVREGGSVRICTPVFDEHARLVGSLAVGGTESTAGENVEVIGATLKRAAQMISCELGCPEIPEPENTTMVTQV